MRLCRLTVNSRSLGPRDRPENLREIWTGLKKTTGRPVNVFRPREITRGRKYKKVEVTKSVNFLTSSV